MAENDRIVRLREDGKADLLDGNEKVICADLDYSDARERALNGPPGGKRYTRLVNGTLEDLT